MTIEANLEKRRPPEPTSAWQEGHRLLMVDPDQSVGLFLEIAIRPATSSATYAAAVLRVDHDPVVLAEDDIACPVDRWEIRASGLWADHVCETALEHWSYGLEAFALAVDAPDGFVSSPVGERVPLGWELEFEAGGSAVPTDQGYDQRGRAHGVLLSAEGSTELEGMATRAHWWGRTIPDRTDVGSVTVPTEMFALVPSAGSVLRFDAGSSTARLSVVRPQSDRASA